MMNPRFNGMRTGAESENPYQPPAQISNSNVEHENVPMAVWLVSMFLIMVLPGIVLLIASLL
ncbi:hypothetical protein NZK35_03480 [Stieleria sp. ICT_E10.1]|uniref:hypothetical protein n=1 Tax=Stieleria sedimenti TaxID=2976331 RepID=UPI00217F2349|nr:hypothetical protein [Stieleria sedimenti]MCS7465735.1 hypothetical protein [Stieleria sedimenti]